jgi:hypothetical protein
MVGLRNDLAMLISIIIRNRLISNIYCFFSIIFKLNEIDW